MIKWYNDENFSISFDINPDISIRYIFPWDSEEYKRVVTEEPFISHKELDVLIEDYKNECVYNFLIPKNYTWDGATINKMFYRIVGANSDNHFLIASLIHDYICENKDVINYDKALATNIFNALLKIGNVGFFKRFLMKNAVAFYQTLFCSWKEEVN